MFMKWCIHNFRLYLVLYLIVNLITILVSGFHIDFTHILVALGLNCFGFLNYKYVRHHISMKESGTFFFDSCNHCCMFYWTVYASYAGLYNHSVFL